MLEDLRKVTAVDPAVAYWATHEMLGLVLGRNAEASADVFAAGNIYHSRQSRELLRQGFSLNLKPSELERIGSNREPAARPWDRRTP
jgi:hypothetical protein